MLSTAGEQVSPVINPGDNFPGREDAHGVEPPSEASLLLQPADTSGILYVHVLSVVDPGKGVCADPVKGGTGPQRREQGASVELGQG